MFSKHGKVLLCGIGVIEGFFFLFKYIIVISLLEVIPLVSHCWEA